jgi:hypothetical protein
VFDSTGFDTYRTHNINLLSGCENNADLIRKKYGVGQFIDYFGKIINMFVHQQWTQNTATLNTAL